MYKGGRIYIESKNKKKLLIVVSDLLTLNLIT